MLHFWGKPRQETKTEAVDEPWSLASSPWVVHPAFDTAKDLLTRIGTTHSEMGPSILTINEGNAPTDASTKESDVTSP